MLMIVLEIGMMMLLVLSGFMVIIIDAKESVNSKIQITLGKPQKHIFGLCWGGVHLPSMVSFDNIYLDISCSAMLYLRLVYGVFCFRFEKKRRKNVRFC